MIRNFTKKIIIPFILCCIFFNISQAQLITYPTPAQPITRGLDSTLLTVRIDFPNCTNVKINVILGTINSPGLIDYIPGSITKIGGTATLTISEDISINLQNPVFKIDQPNVVLGQFIIFTIKRRTNCGTAAATKDKVFVNGNGCNFTEIGDAQTINSVNTYNLLAPALTLSPSAAIINANIGQTYNRTISVINGGNGCTDTLGFWLKYDPNSLLLNSLKFGTITLTPIFSNADSAYYLLSGDVLTTDKLLCNGESVTLTENITVLKCGANTTYGSRWFDFKNNSCQIIQATSGITMSNNTPTLVATIDAPNYNYCFKGDVVKQTIKIKNNGTGAASNLSSYFGSFFTGSFQARYVYDTTKKWVIKNNLGDSIGFVTNFSGITLRSVRNENCVFTSSINSLNGVLKDVFILPGSFVTVDVFTKSENLSCDQCNTTATGWTGIQTNITYKNQCATATYNIGANHMTRAYALFYSTIEMPIDIAAGYPFNINIFYSAIHTNNNPDGSGSTQLVIPLTGLNMMPTATTLNWSIYTLGIDVINDTMYIGPFPQNIIKSGLISIPMIATCGVGGAKLVKPYILNQYGECAPKVRMSCLNFTTNLHCPGPCPKGGATPLSFSLKRINFGLPDNDENHIPDGGTSVLDMNAVADHHSVNGDTLLGKWNIKIYDNADPTDANFGKRVAFVYLDFKCGAVIGNPETLNPMLNPTAIIYPSGGGAAIYCTPTMNILAGGVVHYQLDSICRGMAWQVGDSIVLEAKYTVNSFNGARYNSAQGYSAVVFTTSNQVYSTYIPKTTAQTAPINGQTYTCDYFNDYTQISRIWLSPWIYSGSTINGCTSNGNITSYMRQYVRNQEGANIFPFEYRNFYIPDSMVLEIPSGFTYTLNSGKFYNQLNGANILNGSINNSNVDIVGNKIIFKNLRLFYKNYGGTANAGDETETLYINFGLTPSCENVSGIYPNSTRTSGIGNDLNTPLLYGVVPTIITRQPIGWVYNAPQPNLSGGGTFITSNGTGTWNIVLQNLSNTVAAANSYFYLSPTNDFTNIVVKEGATVLTPNVNGFYLLNNLASSANRNFTITAQTTAGCGGDSLRINYGWSCSGVPAVFTQQNCIQSTLLKLENRPSQIQLIVAKQPTTPSIDLCNLDSVEFVINSALSAYADNPKFIITIPNVGLVLNNAKMEYPVGSGNWQTSIPTINGFTYTYLGENHTGLTALHGTKGLPGTFDFAGTNQRQLKLKLYYTTSCDFLSGSKFIAQQQADRPCGDPIANNLGYNNIVRTAPIYITGAGGQGIIAFDMTMAPSQIACGETTMTGKLIPIIENTGFNDTITITIPVGVTYKPSSFTSAGINLMLVSGSPFIGTNGEQILKLYLNPGILAGTNITYSFKILTNYITACGNYQILTEAKRQYETLSCNGIVCPNPSNAIIGSNITDLIVDKPLLKVINAYKINGELWPIGTLVSLSVTMTNSSTNTAAPTNSVQLEYFCTSGGATPFITLPFNKTVLPSSQATDTMNFYIPNSSLCALGDNVTIKMTPTPGNCICEPDLYLIPGVFVAIENITLTAFKQNKMSNLQFSLEKPLFAGSFIVERSINGKDYNSIAVIQVVAGQKLYEFIDNNPIQTGKNYYRIRQIEMNGLAKLSNVQVLNFGTIRKIEVFPNPAKDKVNIQLPESTFGKQVELELFNSVGQNVISKSIKSAISIVTLDVRKLPAGTYILKVIYENAEMDNVKVIISN